MADFELMYKAFLLDEGVRKNFSTYAVGVEIPSSVKIKQIETVVIEGKKISVVKMGDLHAKLV